MLTSVPITIGTRARIAASRPYRLAVSRNVWTIVGCVLAQVAAGCRRRRSGRRSPGVSPSTRNRHAGPPNLFADRAGLVDAADHRLEPLRQVPHQVEHHLLGAADHERVREIDDTRARARVTTRVRPVERDRPLEALAQRHAGAQPSSRADARHVGDEIAGFDLLGERRPRDVLDAPPPASAMIVPAMSTSGVPMPLPTL